MKPGSWASGTAFTAAGTAGVVGQQREAFEAAIVDVMPDEAVELNAAVEP